jgi:hypothetical protein
MAVLNTGIRMLSEHPLLFLLLGSAVEDDYRLRMRQKLTQWHKLKAHGLACFRSHLQGVSSSPSVKTLVLDNGQLKLHRADKRCKNLVFFSLQ